MTSVQHSALVKPQFGYTSPYPRVVSVTNEKYRKSPTEGWAGKAPPAKQPWLACQAAPKKHAKDKPIARYPESNTPSAATIWPSYSHISTTTSIRRLNDIP